MSWLSSIGHKLGQVATNPWVQGLGAGALALTGVGAPAAAGILGATKGVGNLIKPGGNQKGAATGAAQGAWTGGAAGLAGKLPLSLGGLASGGGTDNKGNLGVLGDLAGKVGGAAGGLGLGSLGGGNLLDMGLGGLAAANAGWL